MGNCIHVMFDSPQKKIKVLIYKGGVQEFEASTPVTEITSGPYTGYNLVHHAEPYTSLPPSTKLEPGEVYYLVPNLAGSGNPLVLSNVGHQGSCKTQKIKIVVTREQLVVLLKSANKLECKDIGAQMPGRFSVEGPQKWRPSLAIIPEAHNL